MSNYRQASYNPATGTVMAADWLDDYFGKHMYGVQFANDGHVYRPEEVRIPLDMEFVPKQWVKTRDRQSAVLLGALREITTWNEEDDKDRETCRMQWRGCVAVAKMALAAHKKLGNCCLLRDHRRRKTMIFRQLSPIEAILPERLDRDLAEPLCKLDCPPEWCWGDCERNENVQSAWSELRKRLISRVEQNDE